METPGFVTRERELQCLEGFLDKALGGQGQVCFVAGEAGSGRTALLTEFARCADAANIPGHDPRLQYVHEENVAAAFLQAVCSELAWRVQRRAR
jgi:predicted ATP-dependent serine protease